MTRVHVQWRDYLHNKGLHVTDVKERFYFHAVYMKEPGNLIFEFATADLDSRLMKASMI